jgi:3-hydroxyisobutyrate dehydrogenase-like beta-hydroxyacid dehydrogenase
MTAAPTPETLAGPIGLFGLGNMGAAIAERLRAAWPVLAYEPEEERAEQVAARLDLELAHDPSQMRRTDVVVLSLPSPAVSRQVVDTLARTLAPGSLVIETSTINPTDAWELRERCEAASLRLVDAAILSGVTQIEQGTSMLLIGGEEADVARAQPVLDRLASRQRHFGPVGSGMSAKVLNNAVAHAVMVILAEVGAIATATGVRRQDLAELLAAPDAGLMRPLTHRFVERMLQGEYEGGMPTEAARKDSALALELAQSSRTPLFAIQAAHTVYELAMNHDLGRLDYAAIARLWEGWTGRSFVDDDAGDSVAPPHGPTDRS